ncbi:MAG: 2OG-Fe dioxygenase family protein [Vicinamibacterales bacterium]
MTGPSSSGHTVLHDAIARTGFAFVEAAEMRPFLEAHGSLADWKALTESWNSLELDGYMADGGRYRRRRHAVFAAGRHAPPVRQPHQPHYQSTKYNPLHGGIARWFEPMTDALAHSASMRTILAACQTLFGGLAPATERWHIEVHQFRIEARHDEQGRPTPEGVHRDGVDYVLVLLIDRRNIASGTTTVHALDGQPLGQFTLQHPFDAALVDDSRVAHGVTPVEAIDPAAPGYRDVLVVTFIDERNRLRA